MEEDASSAFAETLDYSPGNIPSIPRSKFFTKFQLRDAGPITRW